MANITKIIKGLGEATAHIERYVPDRYIGYSKQACIDACELLKTEQPKWIPVEERLPEIKEGKEYFGTECIVCDKYKQVFTLRYCKHTVRKKEVYRWMRDDMSIYYGEVVYWMPFSLPEPPKEGGAE